MPVIRSWFLVLMAVACGGPQKKSSGGVEVLTDTATVVAQHLGSAVLALPYEIANRAGASATLDRVDWKVTLEGEPEQSGNVRLGQPIAAGASVAQALEIPVNVITSDEAFSRRAEASAQRFTVIGSFKIATPGGPEEFEAEWTGELFPSRRPSVPVQAQALRSEGSAELHFILAVKNPNAFTLPIGFLKYVIEVEGSAVATGELARGNSVPAGSERQFDVTRFVGRDDLHDLAKRILKQQSVAYLVKTELETSGRTFTDSLSGAMNFGR
jgi:hypothetical protein